MTSLWESTTVENSTMPLYLSVPERGGPVPGIVVVHGQSGLENFIKETTHMLALQGWARVHRHLIAPARSAVRFKDTSARMIRTHHPTTCASSMPNSHAGISRTSFTPTPAPLTPLPTPVPPTTGPMQRLWHGPKPWIFLAGI